MGKAPEVNPQRSSETTTVHVTQLEPPTARSIVLWCGGDANDRFIVDGLQKMLDHLLAAKNAELQQKVDDLLQGKHNWGDGGFTSYYRRSQFSIRRLTDQRNEARKQLGVAEQHNKLLEKRLSNAKQALELSRDEVSSTCDSVRDSCTIDGDPDQMESNDRQEYDRLLGILKMCDDALALLQPLPEQQEAVTKEVAVSTGVVTEHTGSAVATVCVTEERLNHFLTTLPLETKAQIASEYLGRN